MCMKYKFDERMEMGTYSLVDDAGIIFENHGDNSFEIPADLINGWSRGILHIYNVNNRAGSTGIEIEHFDFFFDAVYPPPKELVR